MPNQATDQELIAAAQRGDRRAFGELVVRYRAGAQGVVYRMCGDALLAEEAAQDAFVRVWQRLSTYRPELSFRAWLYRIAVNAALDALRREHPALSLEALPEDGRGLAAWSAVGPPAVEPAAAYERKERGDLVRQAVTDLPPAARAALVLREWGGLSYAEIAQALDVPPGTVMSRLNSARALLRQRLAAVMEVE
jgi:RNA polymerase sigma-70 factor, ECF subfamily